MNRPRLRSSRPHTHEIANEPPRTRPHVEDASVSRSLPPDLSLWGPQATEAAETTNLREHRHPERQNLVGEGGEGGVVGLWGGVQGGCGTLDISVYSECGDTFITPLKKLTIHNGTQYH
jgi:hypothetical protein